MNLQGQIPAENVIEQVIDRWLGMLIFDSLGDYEPSPCMEFIAPSGHFVHSRAINEPNRPQLFV